MKLSELKSGQGKVDIELKVKSKAEPRVMSKYGRELKVGNAVVTDESGEMKLTLWNEDVDKVNVGDTIKITSGYVSEFNGEKQLTAGKFGKLEVIGKADGSAVEPAAKPEEKTPKTKAKKAKKEESEEGSEEESGPEEENFEEDTF